ncbi:MAG: ATP-binding protein, partial [Chitinophagaceae bacterium]
MPFSSIIGQQETIAQLRSMVQQSRLSHALLFLGKEGTGALPLALAFAQYLVCEKIQRPGVESTQANGPSLFGDEAVEKKEAPPFPPDSCGICHSCITASQLIHPDIHFSFPVIPRKPGDKPISNDYLIEWREFMGQFPYGNVFDWLQFIGAENKQGNITANECADILRKLSLKSFESGYKILVMWMPEYLRNEGNKLLKLIEEPPANTLFLLVAEEESSILPTIISRTQLVRIPPVDRSDIEKALINRANVLPDKARPLSTLADGNYREALFLLQHDEEDWQALVRDWLNAILKSGPVAQVKWVEEIAKLGREKQKQFLRYFNHLLEESIRMRVMGASAPEIPEKERDFAIRLNKLATLSQQQAIIEEIDHAAYYIERNAHGKMLF